MRKAAWLFQVKICEYAVVGNHIHVLIKGPDRMRCKISLGFFAGHTAQKILKLYPSATKTGGAPQKQGCEKNQRKFWSYLLYSEVVSWAESLNGGRYIKKKYARRLSVLSPTNRAPNQESSDGYELSAAHTVD